ncbi:MAG: hypothetical protein SGPRY_009644 [Prymnesium sp.]
MSEVASLRLWLTSPRLEVEYETQMCPKAKDAEYSGTVVTCWLLGPESESEATLALQALLQSERALCINVPLRISYAVPGESGELSIPAMPLERILFWASNKDNLSQSYMLPGMVDLLSSLSRESVMHNKAEEEDLLEGVGQGIEILDSVSVVHATLHILTGVAESLLDGTRDSAVARTSHPRFQETQPPSNLFPNSN